MKTITVNIVRIALALGVAHGAGACIPEPDVGGALAGHCISKDNDPETDVLFSADIRPLFDRPTAMGGCGSCHVGSGPGISLSGFDMASLSAMRRGGNAGGDRVIVPGDPCQSTLVQKLSPAPAIGARMPLSGPPYFSTDEQRLVADWIYEGAEDN